MLYNGTGIVLCHTIIFFIGAFININFSVNLICVINRIKDHVGVKNIALFGIRSADKEEFVEAKNQGLFFVDFFKIKEIGFEKAFEKTKSYLKNKKVYLSLDIDVLDIAFAPGTSTPEPFGLTSFEVLDCIKHISPQLIGFDIVEVCPTYDKGQTAILAAKLIRYLMDFVFF